MKCLVIKIALLVTCCYAVPFKNDNVANGIFADSTGDTSDGINLFSLTPNAYGLPKKSSGDRLATWNKQSLMKPEEMGEYFQGDILMPEKAGRTARSGVIQQGRKWSKGIIIPYVIDGTFTEAENKTIMAAMADYHLLTCLRFVPRTAEEDYISIGSQNTGCWSSIGRIGGQQQVNLQRPACVSKGTVLHELLHAIGMLHEQSRPERDDYVWINFNNIIPDTVDNFEKESAQEYSGYGVEYDYNSVMHYSEYAFSRNQQKTIVPKRAGAQIGQRQGLSYSDVQKVNTMYQCTTRVPAQGWTRLGIYVGGR